MSNKKEVIQALALLASAFDKPLTPELGAAYAVGLDDIPDGKVLAAARSLVKSASFFPRVSEIRRVALSLPNPKGRIDYSPIEIIDGWPYLWGEPCLAAPLRSPVEAANENQVMLDLFARDVINPDGVMSNADWCDYILRCQEVSNAR